MQAEAIHMSVSTLIAALDRSIAAAETSLTGPMSGGEAHLRNIRIDAELSRRDPDRVALRRTSAPSPEL
jgi:hypothetical protein